MNFETEFPVLKDYTYLNTAYSGLLSTSIANWRREHDQLFAAGGSNFRIENGFVINDLRENLSGFFGSKKENTFLVPNFSFGFNTFLSGLDESTRFLILREDYPSISYPVTSSGFEYKEVAIDENIEQSIHESIKNSKPSVFALSLVQYISGYRINPEFIKELKASYPDLLIVADGTQFCGTMKFNFAESGLDALISSGYKWLSGGFGNGFVILSDQMRSAIFQKKKSFAMPSAPFLAGRDILSLCFEPGHTDTLNFGTLNQSLLYLQKVGIDFIEKHTQQLTQKARTEFYSRGLLDEQVLRRETQSTIVNLPLGKELTARIESAGILCSARGSGIRFSFHFYNTEKDLNNLLDVIDDKF
ncbi:MAG: aminotransferase class V-fold PLP-dependent enzyme [Sphingobacteriales bacterium]|nr:MAG: aminotransferase class V-fold PLP-dependent enzyme [Sphingobacteriales bacterium]